MYVHSLPNCTSQNEYKYHSIFVLRWPVRKVFLQRASNELDWSYEKQFSCWIIISYKRLCYVVSLSILTHCLYTAQLVNILSNTTQQNYLWCTLPFPFRHLLWCVGIFPVFPKVIKVVLINSSYYSQALQQWIAEKSNWLDRSQISVCHPHSFKAQFSGVQILKYILCTF